MQHVGKMGKTNHVFMFVSSTIQDDLTGRYSTDGMQFIINWCMSLNVGFSSCNTAVEV